VKLKFGIYLVTEVQYINPQRDSKTYVKFLSAPHV